MNRLTLILLFELLSFYSVFPQSPSLIGPQGLILTPTARFPVDGQIRMGYSNIREPHAFIKWGDKTTQNHLVYTTLVFLPRLELTGLLTFAPGTHGNDGSDTYKDLAVFAQYHLLRETHRRPNLAIGLYDFHSYSWYNALFFVAGKTFTPTHTFKICTNFGYGVDWIDTHLGDTGPDKDASVPHHLVGLFGGIELQYLDIAALLVEYDTSQLNAGVRLVLFNRLDLLLTAMEFKTFCLGISYRFPLFSSN